MMFRHLAGLEKVHFVGIGGAGMSGIAEVLLHYDLEVSGSDLVASAATERLVSKGARVRVGHHGDAVHGTDLVVISSAVGENNPEVVEARRLGITVARRAEMLGELMRLKYGIGVAGTHGKTTTTSLVGTLLTEAGLDPTVIVGGRLRVSGTGARVGKSDYLVAEADEFDRSFLRLSPIVAVITNIDCDHLDTYGNLENIRDAFVDFAGRVPFFGQILACLDNREVQGVLPRLRDRRIVTYGFSPQADLMAQGYEADGFSSRFEIRHHELGVLGALEVPLPGRHNVQNALAAVGVGLALDLDFATIARCLAAFSGVHRRFERRGTFQGAEVFDDYAHHPTEVEATLAAARGAFPNRRIVALFQPHLYSRTSSLREELGRSLLGSDVAYVTDVYGSREEPLPGVTGELVVEAARAAGHRSAHYSPSWADLPKLLEAEVGKDDVILTLGAGDIVRLASRLTERDDS